MNTAQPDPKTLPRYFFLLDIFRGLAALAVVLWHWKNFYYQPDGSLLNFRNDAQPLYSVLYLFYDAGDIAVDLFFLISGFVFFFLYAKTVAAHKITSLSFFILRFSRLYPLQFVTLLLVLLLQNIIYASTGGYFVCVYNDAYHFILNIFFASSWGLEKDHSFNFPNWSVSVEVLLYLLFFVLCYYRLHKKYILVALMVLGIIVQSVYSPIGRGLFSFFLGGLVYYLYIHIVSTGKAAGWLKVLRILTIGFILLLVINNKYKFLEGYALQILETLRPGADNTKLIEKTLVILVRLFIFPVVLLFTVLLETLKGPIGKRFAFIGHLSYSSYLLHFPLQLLFLYYCSQLGIQKFSFFESPYVLGVFFAVLIIISLISYNYFELPMQNYLRKRLLKKQAATRA